MKKEDMKGKKILAVGFGRTGEAVAMVMSNMGSLVTIQDSRMEDEFDANLITYFRDLGVKFHFGAVPEDLNAFDLIVLSPGVSPELDFVSRAASEGIEVIGELELAYRLSNGKYIAITGTNGKTTTTTMVGEIFKTAGRSFHVAGNIGKAVIQVAVNADTDDYLITEVSSFQLETTVKFRPIISAILNLTEDHLNRHHTMEAYGAAKARIFANQKGNDCLIVNYDDDACMALTNGCRARIIPFSTKKELETGAFVRDGLMILRRDGNETSLFNVNELKIIGKHNIQNALAAAAIAFWSGIDSDMISEALIKFKGVEHRIEYCGLIDGVKYYNDSKGTNTDASITAIKALVSNIVLIAGGDGKSQDFTPFAEMMPGRVKKLILFGKDAGKISEACSKINFKNICFCKDMNDSVIEAASAAEPGDSVMLSPACASWDMYDNYEQRGRHFKQCVTALSYR